MNEGLENTKYFFYFISNNSLQSKMVDLEWQSTLYRKAKNNIIFVPVKIDNSNPPAILLSTLYIDMYTYGFEDALRQIFDVIENRNSNNIKREFHNVIAKIKYNSEYDSEIEIKAEYLHEPISRFLIVYKNQNANIESNLISDSVSQGGRNDNLVLNDGQVYNGIFLGLMRSLAPGFPVRINIKTKNQEKLESLGVMKAVDETQYKFIPITETHINKII